MKRAHGFTAIELVVFMCEIALGCAVAVAGGKRFGGIGLAVGFVVGFAIIPGLFFTAVGISRLRARRRG